MTNLVDSTQRLLGDDMSVGPLGYGCWRLVNMCLGVEQLDLYQVHRPDLSSYPEETARILQRLKDSGKVGSDVYQINEASLGEALP